MDFPDKSGCGYKELPKIVRADTMGSVVSKGVIPPWEHYPVTPDVPGDSTVPRIFVRSSGASSCLVIYLGEGVEQYRYIQGMVLGCGQILQVGLSEQ